MDGLIIHRSVQVRSKREVFALSTNKEKQIPDSITEIRDLLVLRVFFYSPLFFYQKRFSADQRKPRDFKNS